MPNDKPSTRPGSRRARRPAARRPRSKPEPVERRVLVIGSEALPFSKTGGLADVLSALPPALARLGWNVTLVVPKYRGVHFGTFAERFTVTVGGFSCYTAIFEAPLSDGALAVLVDCPKLYDRDALYSVDNVDYPDNALRFAFLARAALEYAARRDAAPDVVHAHDWQAGLAPVYLKTLYADHPMLGGTPSVFTIHNLAYQGLFEPDWLPRLDLGWELFTMEQLEYWGRISYLKGGINHSEFVTTVSKRYAQEIQTPEFGFGFDGILGNRSADVVGIMNGIDVDEWNPATDRFLPKPYSADDMSGKADAKAALLERYGLTNDSTAMARPLIGIVSRMVEQKGFDLIAQLADDLPRLDASFVVLGTGDQRFQDFWTNLAAAYPDRIGARVGFEEELAHLIEAGADIFLMPSRFEPSGLNQMYSLRYGTVPVVREVGGLADTVRNYTPRSTKATGFVFRDYAAPSLLHALQRALEVYRDKKKWRALQLAGMKEDHSWDHSAREYVKIYDRAIARGGRFASAASV